MYISRCAAVFINDGNNVRGDMQAVLTEILTDPEARAGDTGPQPSDGHLREPILWMTGVMRGLGYVNVDPNNYWDNLSTHSLASASGPLASPSVFNFFPPSYVIPGTTLNAPEFGLENTASVMDRLTLADNLDRQQHSRLQRRPERDQPAWPVGLESHRFGQSIGHDLHGQQNGPQPVHRDHQRHHPADQSRRPGPDGDRPGHHFIGI